MSDQSQSPPLATPTPVASPVTADVQAGPPGPGAPAPEAPVVAAPVAAPAEPVKPAPRALNPYAAAKAAKAAAEAPPVDPRIAALEASNAEHLATLSTYASTELANAPEGVRNAVKAIAGDNPAAQLKALAALRANGVGVAPTVAPLTVGATTAPTAAPPVAAPVANPDNAILARYEDLKAKGANLLATQFRSQNAEALNRAEAARSVH